MVTFDEALARYRQYSGINPRASVPLFQGLANQGSIAAGFTAGLLSAQADWADREERLLAASLQGENLKLETQKVANDTSRTASQGMLNQANANKLAVDTQGQVIQNRLLNTYGDQKEQANIGMVNSNAYQARMSGLNSLEDARGRGIGNKLLATYGPSKEAANIANVKAQTISELTNAKVAVTNAGTNQYNAVTQRYNADTQRFDANNDHLVNMGQLGVQQYVAVTGRMTAQVNANQDYRQQGIDSEKIKLQREEYANQREHRNATFQLDKQKLEADVKKAQADAEISGRKLTAEEQANKLRLQQLTATEKRQTELFELSKLKLQQGEKLNPYQQAQLDKMKREGTIKAEQAKVELERSTLKRFESLYNKSGEGAFNSPSAKVALSKLPPASLDIITSLIGNPDELTEDQILEIINNRKLDLQDKSAYFSTLLGEE